MHIKQHYLLWVKEIIKVLEIALVLIVFISPGESMGIVLLVLMLLLFLTRSTPFDIVSLGVSTKNKCIFSLFFQYVLIGFMRPLRFFWKFCGSLDVTKTVSAMTLVCFLISSVLGQGFASFLAQQQETRQLTHVVDGFTLPPYLGKITDARFYGSKEIVINIQDLHCHSEVQKNISAIIKLLNEKLGVEKVYLEGAVGAVDTSWLGNFPDKKLKTEVAQALIEKGMITGAEYYSVLSGKPQLITGLENEQLYTENVGRLNRILSDRKKMEGIVTALTKQLEPLSETFYCRKNQRFESIIKKYRAGKIDSRKYYVFLRKYGESIGIDVTSYKNIMNYQALIDEQKRLNYSRLTHELQQFVVVLKQRLPYAAYRSVSEQTNNFSRLDNLCFSLSRLGKNYPFISDIVRDFPCLGQFFVYVQASQRLNPLTLVREEQKLVSDIKYKLADSESEREVVFLNNYMLYLNDYVNNKIAAADCDYCENNINRFTFVWGKYESDSLVNELVPYLATLKDFYRVNKQRNLCFVKNLMLSSGAGVLRTSNGENDVDTILPLLDRSSNFKVTVMGGFHTEGFTEILKEKHISYLVITPNVTQKADAAEKIYTDTIEQQARESAVIAAQTLAVQALSENPLEMKKLKVLTAFLSYQLAKGIKKDDIEKDLHSILALLGDPRDKNATFAFTHVNSIENFGFIITSTLEGQQVTNTYEYNQGKYTLHGDKISRISSHAELRRGVISWLKGLWVFITNIGRSTGISEKKVPTAEKPSTEEYILQSMLADHVDFGWANRWYGLYRNHADKEAFGNAVKRLLFNADESIYRGAAWILSQPEFLGPVPAMDNGHDQTSSVVSWNDQSVLSILLFWYDRKTQKLIENFYIDNKNDSSKQQMILAQMISAAIHTKEKNLPKNRALDAIYDLLNLNISIKDILSHTDPDLYEKLTRDNIDLNIPGNGKFGISPYRAQKLGLQPFTSESPFLSPLGADDVLIERSALETLDNATRGVEKPSLVAIGDVHGKIDLFKDALVHAGLAKFINNGVTWTGGTATLVLTGDIVNGQKTKEVFELIKKLAALADIDGGQIVWTLGNHDVFSDIKGGQGGRGKQGYEIWPEVANILINKSVKGLTIAGAYFAQGKIFVHGGIVPFVEHTIQQEITAQKKRINPGQVTTTASPQEIVNYINTTLIHYLDNKTDHRMYTNDADLPDIFKPGTSRDDHPILPHEEGYKPGGIFNAGDIELALSESDIEYPQIIAHSSSEFGFPRDTTGGRVDAEAKIITLDVGRKRRNGNSYLIFNGWAWIAVNPEDGHREIIHVTPAFTRIAQTTLEKMINVKTWSGLTSDKKESILLKVFSQTLSHLQQRESGKKEVQSDSKSVRGNRETVRRLLSMIGEATRRVIARHNENVLERGSESKIRVTQTTEEVDNPQAIALDIAKATRALAHDDNSKNLKQALELMDEWEKMDRKTTAPYQPVAFVELILVKAKEIIEETKLSSNTFGPDYKKSAMVYRLISRLALATAGDIEKALALNSLDKKQRDDLSQLKEKFGVVSLYALEYLRAIDYASVLEVLSAYFYNRAAWMERFNIAPLIRKIFSVDKGFKQSKKGLLTQLALVAALGNYIKPGLYDRTKMYPAMNSYIETLEYKNGHHEFLWDTLWDNRKALQYTLTVVVGVIILIVAPPTFSFGITGIPSLLSSGFIVNIILHWFFISKGTKDTFYTTNKAITQRYLAGASELAAVISVAHQAMPEAMQAPASLPEGDLPIVDVAQHYFTLWAGALEEPDFGGAQLQTILESVSTIMLRTRLSPALLDVPNMGLIANIYDRYLELSEETMKKIAELDVSDPKLKVMAAKITVAHKYAYEYNRAIDYAYTRQMLSNYKIASNSRLYFLEKVKIASIVRLILGISVATGASRVLLKNKIEKIIVLGNKVIPSMYKNPDVLINYVHDKSNNNESIALPEVGLSGPWKTRRMLSRFVPLLLLARPFIIALVSAHPVTMGAFLFSFISGFGLVMVLHWVPVLLSFYSRNFHQHRRFGERLISAGDLTDELNEDLVLKAGEYADIIKRHALGQPRTVVTIVGDPLVGTSTFAKELASAIDFNYLDVESLYRLITVKALHQGIDLNSTTAVNAFVNKNFNSEQNISQLRLVNGDMHWGDEIVSAQELKTFDIKMNSAIVERNQLVQEWVSAVAISAMNEEKNWVVDGTIPSIPTVAEFYVSAFADLRAWRKLAFYVTSGEGFSFTEEEETNLLENIRKLGAASSMNRTKARAQGLYEIPADTALKTSNTYGVIVSMMEHMVHKINTMTPLTYQIDASGRYAGKFTGAEARRKFLAEREEGLNKNAAEHHTRPSNKRYPWMWYWDTILQGMGMLHFNIPRIKDEILTFISAQWPNGMFPNMVRVFISENIQEAVRRFFIAASQFNPIAALSALYDYINAVIQWKTFGSIHNPQTHSSGITQPPIAAEGVLAIYRMDVEKNINAKEFLEKTFDQLYRNFKWIESTRINHTQGAEGWGLMRIIHAWETGADSKVSLDRAYPNDTWFKKVLFWILNKRYIKLLFNLAKKYPVIREVKRNNFEQSSFEVCALDMSSFLYRNLEALAEIALELGKTNEVGIIRDWQDELKKAILGTWNEHNGGFMDFGRVNGTFQELDVMTPQMFLPLYAFDPSKLDKESRDKMMPYVQRMVREIFNPETFWTKYPLPTVAINDPSYNPKEYWRGDTWVNINYFIIKGLIQWGYRNEAKELIYKTLEMIDKGGPRERFNSQTGKGLGAHNFGWTNGLGIELISLLEHIERVEDSQQGVVEVNGASGSVFGKDNENIYLAV
ncbi:MAG: trehalase family glycosidase, partial [Endomicrobiales bacterium]